MHQQSYETAFGNYANDFGKSASKPVKCMMITLSEGLDMDDLDEMTDENHKKYLQFWIG